MKPEQCIVPEQIGNPMRGRRLAAYSDGVYADDDDARDVLAYRERMRDVRQDVEWTIYDAAADLLPPGQVGEAIAKREEREMKILQAPNPAAVIIPKK